MEHFPPRVTENLLQTHLKEIISCIVSQNKKFKIKVGSNGTLATQLRFFSFLHPVSCTDGFIQILFPLKVTKWLQVTCWFLIHSVEVREEQCSLPESLKKPPLKSHWPILACNYAEFIPGRQSRSSMIQAAWSEGCTGGWGDNFSTLTTKTNVICALVHLPERHVLKHFHAKAKLEQCYVSCQVVL